MTFYLDTSVLISLFHEDGHTRRVTDWIAAVERFVFSTWTLAEFSSALAIQSRMRRLADRDRRGLELRLDQWLATRLVLPVAEGDVIEARRLIRADPRLRAPDALHLAVVARNDCVLATLDEGMGRSARDLGLTTVIP